MLRDVAEYFQLGAWRRPAGEGGEAAVADVVVGVATSFHDGAVAVLHEDEIFAEALERPCQLKRAMLVGGQYYALRSLARGVFEKIAASAKDVRVMVRTTWRPKLLVRIVGDVYVRLLRLRARFPLRAVPPDVPMPIVYSTRLPQIWFWDSALFPVHHIKNDLLPRQTVEARARATPHHLTHAANAVFTSPFERCAVMVLDGQGEWWSLTCYAYANGRFERVAASRDSLGLLYADVTALCGFSPAEGEEWKVMGLAAYGAVDPRIRDFFRECVRLDGLSVRIAFGPREVRRLRELAGPFRAPDDPDVMKAARLAASFQAFFAETVVELARALHGLGISDALAYAGGCALNSAANGMIVGGSGFKSLHVPSAPADDGNALGAALYERHVDRGLPYRPRTLSPYLGSLPDLAELERILGFGGIPFVRCATDEELAERIAALLAKGEIVGVMQGRAEFGPRALGHRSLLADPRRADTKAEINRLVKFREDYRPLAPAILDEHGPAWFEGYQSSPYMERALPFKDAVKALVPAVVHADGTGRLQSVTKEMSPGFHAIVSAFHRATGVPLVVNTSLNVMGRPIVHSVKDAVQILYTSGLRHLAVGRCLLSK